MGFNERTNCVYYKYFVPDGNGLRAGIIKILKYFLPVLLGLSANP